MKCDICDKIYTKIIKMQCGKYKVCGACINYLIEREIKEIKEWNKVTENE